MYPQHDPAVLGQAAFGDVQARHDLDPRDHRRRRAHGWGFGQVQHAIDPVTDVELVLEGFDMNIRSALLDRPLQQQVDQANHRCLRGEVLEVFDIGLLVAAVVFQVFDQRAHGRAALAVIALDQLLDIAAQADGQAHRALAGILQRVQGMGLVRVGNQHVQFTVGRREWHQAMLLEEARCQLGRVFQQFRCTGQGQQGRAEQGRPGLGEILFRDQAQARQQFGSVLPRAAVLQLLGAVEIGGFQAAGVDQPVDGKPAQVLGHQGVHGALSRLHAYRNSLTPKRLGGYCQK